MKEIKETCYKGTRILVGNEKRAMINKMIDILIADNFTEIQVPMIQFQETFDGKVGAENNNMMYNFTDRGNRNICLPPEITAVVQKLSKTTYNREKDVKLFYVAQCFRGEKPQQGRYREFTQLGIEILNPSIDYDNYLLELAKTLMNTVTTNYTVTTGVSRGLDYYIGGKGFEMACDELGSSKQVCGGGTYDGGIGFALGIDRILLVK